MIDEWDKDKKVWLQRRPRASIKIYKEKRKVTKIICRSIKSQIQELNECDKDEVKKFYLRVKYQKKGSNYDGLFGGNLLGSRDEMKRAWS